MTDYKQICRDLIAAIDAEAREHTLGFELLKAYAEAEELLLLCGHAPGPELQPAGPTDDELIQLAIDTRLYRFQATAGDPIVYELTEAQIHAFARAALARWGSTPSPDDTND